MSFVIGLLGILADSLRDVLERIPRSRSEFDEQRPDSIREALERVLTEDAQYGRFNRYAAVGLVGVTINEGTLFLVTGVVGLSYVIGGLAGRIVSVVFNFVLNDAWTWRSRGEAGLGHWLDRCWKYLATRIVGIAIGLAALIAFVELAGLHYLLANLLAIAVGAFWGYTSSEFWVWRDGSKPPLSARLPDWTMPRRTHNERANEIESTRETDSDSPTVGDTPAYSGGETAESDLESGCNPDTNHEPDPDGFGPENGSNDENNSEPRTDGGTAPDDDPGSTDKTESETGRIRWRLARIAEAASATAGRVRRHFEQHGRATRTRMKAVDRGTWLVLTLSATLAAWFSWYTIQLYQGFALTGADFGSYVHMFSSTIHGEGFLKQGKYRLNHPDQVYWGAHFTLTLLLYLPVYAVFPSAETLLVAKSVVLGASIVLLWFLARAKLESQYLAGLVVVSYAFNPFLWSAWSFDFQEQTLIPLFVFGAYYAYVKRHRVAFLVLILLALLTNEFAIPLVGGFVLALWVSAYRGDEFHERLPTIVAALVLVAFAHVLAGAVIAYFSRYGGIPVRVVAIPFQGVLDGPRVSMGEVILAGLTNPDLMLESLFQNADEKLLYLLALMLPVGLLSLTDEHTLFALAPFLGFAWVFSHGTAYWSFSAHYPLYFLPFVYIGLVHTLDRLTLPTVSREWFGRLLVYVILLNIITAALVGPLNVQPIPEQTEQHERIQAAVDEVPEDAYLLVQNNHFPHVADRPEVTFVVTEYEIEQYQEELGPLTPEYIMYDTRTSGLWPRFVQEAFGDRLGSEYGVYRYEEGTWVFKRGYQGDPQPITGERTYDRFDGERTYEPADLEIGYGTVEGDRIVVDSDGNGEETGVAWFGPYEILSPGTYTASFDVQVEGEGAVGNVHVSTGAGEEIIEQEELTQTDGVETAELTFSSDQPIADVELRGVHNGGEGTIELEAVELVAEEPPVSADPNASPGRFDPEVFAPGPETDDDEDAGVDDGEDAGVDDGEDVGTVDGEMAAPMTGARLGANQGTEIVNAESKETAMSTPKLSTFETEPASVALNASDMKAALEVSRA